MSKLSGKNVFVTGTSQGIGAAIAQALIEVGCNICMHYFSSNQTPEILKNTAENKNLKACCVQGDLTREVDVKHTVRTAVECLGGIDILVNNSGSLVERRFLPDVNVSYFETVFDINLKSMMLVTKECLPFFNQTTGSSIINISSLAGRKGGHAGSLIYSTAKGAVLTWTRSLAGELGPKGIRVNAVAPGFIEGTSFHQTHTTPESAKKTIADIPLGRSGCPEDVARAVVFLAGEYDGFISGATLDINGGIYCA